MDSGKNSNNLGEGSFPGYLGTAEEKLRQKITESVQHPHHSFASSPQLPSSISLERTKSEEGEIDIFEAHGYRKANQVDLLRVKTKSRSGTPTVSSEVSLNSQTALLPSYQRSQPRAQSKPKRVHGKSGFLDGLNCHGSCTGKESVYVAPNVEQAETVRGREHRKEATQIVHRHIMLNGIKLQPRLKVKDEFHKPVSDSGVQNLAIKRQLAKKKIMEEESQKPLDKFGSHKLNKEAIETSLERKLSMLSLDAIPKNPKLPTSSMRSQEYEDIESDDSSDLFELENIPGNGQALFTRGTSDGVSGCIMSPTPCAPTETCIEGSVVTASAADFSAISDHDETKLSEKFCTSPGASKVAKTKSIVDEAAQTGCSIKLLGCKSREALRVAEDAYRRTKKPMFQPQRPVTHVPVRKLQADTDEK